jgi:hypothetical protein
MGRALFKLRPAQYLGLVALFAAALLPPGPAVADTPKPLVLPIAITVAVVRGAVGHAMAVPGSTHRLPAGTGLLTLLPSQLEIPDGYELDVGRRVPSFAKPVDSDCLVGVNLNGRPWHGWRASLNVNEETQHPVGSTSTQFSVVVEYGF